MRNKRYARRGNLDRNAFGMDTTVDGGIGIVEGVERGND